MELIFLLVPGFFFLLSLLDVSLHPGKVSLGLPRDWVRVESEKGVDALSGLEFISEAQPELSSLKSRARYVYVKGA